MRRHGGWQRGNFGRQGEEQSRVIDGIRCPISVVKVLHVVPALFDARDGIVGGAERYVYELARNMAKRVETRLLTFGRADRLERVDDLTIRVIANPVYVRGESGNPISHKLIPEVLNADVVHAHQRHTVAASVCALTARMSRRKIFVTELGGGGWDFSWYFNTDRWFHGHLHISEYSRKIAGHSALPRAHVILAGVDSARFHPGQGRGSELLFVGRLMPHKGIDVLIDALPPDLELRVVGAEFDQSYAQRLRQLARGKRVTFAGQLDEAELPATYRSAMAVVLPSVHRDCYGRYTPVPELLGQTLLEGMASGLPAIATSVGSLPEVVRDGETGILVSPNDPIELQKALRLIADNPARASRLGAAGREWVLRQFSWETTVDRCLSIYGQGK